MKTRMTVAGMVLTLLTMLFSSQTSNAYYDSGVQRWVNRDPINERGFSRTRDSKLISIFTELGEVNLYLFVGNRPVDVVDRFGLELYWPLKVGGNCNSDEVRACKDVCFARNQVLNQCTHVSRHWRVLIFDNGVTRVWEDHYESWTECQCLDPRSCPPPSDTPGNDRNRPPPIFPPRW